MDLCARCEHPRKLHCSGGVDHVGHYKSDREYHAMCHTKHCFGVLCSCVDFIEPAQEGSP